MMNQTKTGFLSNLSFLKVPEIDNFGADPPEHKQLLSGRDGSS